jgi:hypothetical protein
MKKSGFIFLYSLFLSLLALFIGAYIFTRGVFFPPYARLAHDRAVARQLALGTFEWVRAGLARPKKEEKKEAGQEKQKLSPDTEELLLLFPSINRWQTFELKSETDGITAVVRICVTDEEGKINLNSVWNFDQKKFMEIPMRGSTEKIIQELSVKLESLFQVKGFKEGLSQFFKKRKGPLSDVTELLEDEYFKKNFQDALFYDPPTGAKGERTRIFLTDLFTTQTNDFSLNAFLLSYSLCALFGLQQTGTIKEREEQLLAVSKKLPARFAWPKDWNTYLEQFYKGKFPFSFFPEIAKSAFKPTIFSVLCEVTVGEISERLYAIIERKKRSQNKEIMYDVNITRLYNL